VEVIVVVLQGCHDARLPLQGELRPHEDEDRPGFDEPIHEILGEFDVDLVDTARAALLAAPQRVVDMTSRPFWCESCVYPGLTSSPKGPPSRRLRSPIPRRAARGWSLRYSRTISRVARIVSSVAQRRQARFGFWWRAGSQVKKPRPSCGSRTPFSRLPESGVPAAVESR
jgi:hypothetical protein